MYFLSLSLQTAVRRIEESATCLRPQPLRISAVALHRRKPGVIAVLILAVS